MQLDCNKERKLNAQYLEKKELYLSRKGNGRLALSFRKQMRKFGRSVEHLNEILLPFYLINGTDRGPYKNQIIIYLF